MVDSAFSQGYDDASETNWATQVDAVNEIVTDIALESFQCAEDLFYHGDRANTTEAFPFGEGCRDASDCSINQYDFPVSIDMTTTETKKKYVALGKRTACDPGYEVPQENCIEAGLAVGGSLKMGTYRSKVRPLVFVLSWSCFVAFCLTTICTYQHRRQECVERLGPGRVIVGNFVRLSNPPLQSYAIGKIRQLSLWLLSWLVF